MVAAIVLLTLGVKKPTYTTAALQTYKKNCQRIFFFEFLHF